MKTRNSETLNSFVAYCDAHPSERFWQALLNWSGLPYILMSTAPGPDVQQQLDGPGCAHVRDTFYWEGRNS